MEKQTSSDPPETASRLASLHRHKKLLLIKSENRAAASRQLDPPAHQQLNQLARSGFADSWNNNKVEGHLGSSDASGIDDDIRLI